MKNLDSNALGMTLGILGALWMLILGILAAGGVYLDAFEAMQAFHIGLTVSFGGVLLGIIEAAICGYIGGYLLGWFYNKFAK